MIKVSSLDYDDEDDDDDSLSRFSSQSISRLITIVSSAWVMMTEGFWTPHTSSVDFCKYKIQTNLARHLYLTYFDLHNIHLQVRRIMGTCMKL